MIATRAQRAETLLASPLKAKRQADIAINVFSGEAYLRLSLALEKVDSQFKRSMYLSDNIS